jgi:hypothetical protein
MRNFRGKQKHRRNLQRRASKKSREKSACTAVVVVHYGEGKRLVILATTGYYGHSETISMKLKKSVSNSQ